GAVYLVSLLDEPSMLQPVGEADRRQDVVVVLVLVGAQRLLRGEEHLADALARPGPGDDLPGAAGL
ncbi:MAG: hypothetical protein KJ717_10805, partial [Proteobacteria bacterium]|nr:hypothetical protein [Pseudomonadota bacterium]